MSCVLKHFLQHYLLAFICWCCVIVTAISLFIYSFSFQPHKRTHSHTVTLPLNYCCCCCLHTRSLFLFRPLVLLFHSRFSGRQPSNRYTHTPWNLSVSTCQAHFFCLLDTHFANGTKQNVLASHRIASYRISLIAFHGNWANSVRSVAAVQCFPFQVAPNHFIFASIASGIKLMKWYFYRANAV